MEEPAVEPSVDPVAVTKAHLSQIGEIWVDFAKKQAETYRAKLPDAIKQYLQPSPAEAPDTSADPPSEGEAA